VGRHTREPPGQHRNRHREQCADQRATTASTGVTATARRRRWLVAAVLLVSASFIGAPRAAYGHALLSRSDPAPGAVTPGDQPPRRLSLQFTEPVKVDRNAVVVLDAQGRRVRGTRARVAAEDAARVELDPGPLPPGAYAVRWRAVSADNHVVRGTYWFVVGFAQAPPPASLLAGGPPALSMIETIGRWLALLATLGLAGAPLFTLLVLWRSLDQHKDSPSPASAGRRRDPGRPRAGAGRGIAREPAAAGTDETSLAVGDGAPGRIAACHVESRSELGSASADFASASQIARALRPPTCDRSR